MRLIPDYIGRKLTCHGCGETRSVKYSVDLYDGQGNYLDTVTLCNKCALDYKAMEERSLNDRIHNNSGLSDR